MIPALERAGEYRSQVLDDELRQLETALQASWHRLVDLPAYANNAAAKAGGLKDGDLYRTSTGVVMVVYT